MGEGSLPTSPPKFAGGRRGGRPLADLFFAPSKSRISTRGGQGDTPDYSRKDN